MKPCLGHFLLHTHLLAHGVGAFGLSSSLKFDHHDHHSRCNVERRHAPVSTSRKRPRSRRAVVNRRTLSTNIRHHPDSRSSLLVLEAAAAPYFGSWNALSLSQPAAAAAMGLAVSALTGWKVDQTFPDSGILVTLLLSSFLSHQRLVPLTSPLYNVCWTVFLPASLALLLLSMNNNSKSSVTNQAAAAASSAQQQPGESGNDNTSIAAAVQRVFIPFAIASFGSVLGCLFSFVLCQRHYATAATAMVSAPSNPLFLLPLAEARIAVSCLTASFVGGSVNFFATANQIATSTTTTATTLSSSSPSSAATAATAAMTIVSSMAAADILVMLLYFALLGAALQSKTMKRWFLVKDNVDNIDTRRRPQVGTSSRSALVNVTSTVDDDDDDYTSASTPSSSRTALQPLPPLHPPPKEPLADHNSNNNVFSVLSSTTVACTLALGIVCLASRVEQFLANAVPGMACAVIVALVPLLKRGIHQCLIMISSRRHLASQIQQTWNNVQDIAEPLSQISFFLLFASIGVSANLAGAVHTGPACLFLSLVAMLVHLIVTIGVSLLVRWRGLFWFLPHRWLPWMSRTRRTTSSIRLEDVLIASNAAIGGPATAAAFCSRIRGPRQQGLTYAAVVWGVFGYAIGTTMGILVYRFLGYAFQL